MSTIRIGRNSDNDFVVNDPSVSRYHCMIVVDGERCVLIDTNSQNGTYVNGRRIYGEYVLRPNDQITVGYSIIPWIQLCGRSNHSNSSHGSSVSDSRYGVDVMIDEIGYTEDESTSSKASALGVIALVLSLVGLGFLVFAGVLLMKWGIFAWMGSASTYVIVSFVSCLLSGIMGSIADESDDSSVPAIAKGISGFCVAAIIAFYIYIRTS